MNFYTLRRLTVLLLFVTVLAGCAMGSNDIAQYKGKTAQEIYTSGEKDMRHHNYKSAVKRFEALQTLYPYGLYSQKAQLAKIKSYYKSGDPASALASASRYIQLYPRDPQVDYAYFMKGVVNMGRDAGFLMRLAGAKNSERDLSYTKMAYLDFHDLVHLFPHSRYTPDALKRMEKIRGILASHDLEVATFYYQRKAYVGAANRANLVVQHFPKTPQARKALVLMAKSYAGMGEPGLASQARARLMHAS